MLSFSHVRTSVYPTFGFCPIKGPYHFFCSWVSPLDLPKNKYLLQFEVGTTVCHQHILPIFFYFQVHWLKVGTLSEGQEEDIDGYVLQADVTGIKAAWEADDHQSGVVGYKVAVGTSKGIF